jgi:hypothetical protein
MEKESYMWAMAVSEKLRMHLYIKVKVKVALVQAVRLCTGRKDHRGSRGIALPFHDHSTKCG